MPSRFSDAGQSGFAIAIARAFGAGRLLASDHVPYRIALARQLGADDVVDVDAVENDARVVRRAQRGVGMGIVFEMSGALRAIEDAFAIVRRSGNVVLFGPARATIDVAESLIFKNHREARSTAVRSGRRGTRRAGCSNTALSTCGR